MILFDKEIKRPGWLPRWLNLPFVVVMVFLVSLLFFGDNNIMQLTRYKRQISELKMEIKNNEDSARIYDAKVQELNTDRNTMERIAREKYNMKRSNEDVYITRIP